MEDQDLRVGAAHQHPNFVSSHTRFSALHHAALGGSLELIALLLEAQATVDIKDSNGETPKCPRLPVQAGRGPTQTLGPELAPMTT